MPASVGDVAASRDSSVVVGNRNALQRRKRVNYQASPLLAGGTRVLPPLNRTQLASSTGAVGCWSSSSASSSQKKPPIPSGKPVLSVRSSSVGAAQSPAARKPPILTCKPVLGARRSPKSAVITWPKPSGGGVRSRPSPVSRPKAHSAGDDHSPSVDKNSDNTRTTCPVSAPPRTKPRRSPAVSSTQSGQCQPATADADGDGKTDSAMDMQRLQNYVAQMPLPSGAPPPKPPRLFRQMSSGENNPLPTAATKTCPSRPTSTTAAAVASAVNTRRRGGRLSSFRPLSCFLLPIDRSASSSTVANRDRHAGKALPAAATAAAGLQHVYDTPFSGDEQPPSSSGVDVPSDANNRRLVQPYAVSSLLSHAVPVRRSCSAEVLAAGASTTDTDTEKTKRRSGPSAIIRQLPVAGVRRSLRRHPAFIRHQRPSMRSLCCGSSVANYVTTDQLIGVGRPVISEADLKQRVGDAT